MDLYAAEVSICFGNRIGLLRLRTEADSPKGNDRKKGNNKSVATKSPAWWPGFFVGACNAMVVLKAVKGAEAPQMRMGIRT